MLLRDSAISHSIKQMIGGHDLALVRQEGETLFSEKMFRIEENFYVKF